MIVASRESRECFRHVPGRCRVSVGRDITLTIGWCHTRDFLGAHLCWVLRRTITTSPLSRRSISTTLGPSDPSKSSRTSSERGGPTELLLIAVPTQRASDIVFPFTVVEGKAYSTGIQIFEAQNQAAVSGASGLKIQLSLNELVKRSTTSSDVPPSLSKDQPPLFFSIYTEGPYHEL